MRQSRSNLFLLRFAVFFILIQTSLFGISITEQFGNIKIKKQNSNEWKSLNENSVIETGDFIKSSSGSDIKLDFDGITAKISGDSHFSILETHDELYLNFLIGNAYVENKSNKTVSLNTSKGVLSFKDAEVLFAFDSSKDLSVIFLEGSGDFLENNASEPYTVGKSQKLFYANNEMYINEFSASEVERYQQNMGLSTPMSFPQNSENQNTEPENQQNPNNQSSSYSGNSAPQETAESSSEGGLVPGLDFSGNVGSQSFDDKIYSRIVLNPEFSAGKFAIGLDMAFHFDEKGKIREEDWNEFEDYLEKVTYVRYGRKGDPFHIRAGALDVTLGNGFIVKNYSNRNRYPQERNLGVFSGFDTSKWGFDAFAPNVLDLNVIGARFFSRPISFIRPIEVGFSVAADLNTSSNIDLDSVGTESQSFVFGADVQYLLVKSRMLDFVVYSDYAKINDYGYGLVFPGVRLKFMIFDLAAEYRYLADEFQPSYFDKFYEVERAFLTEDSTIIYKEDKLKELKSSKGFYGQLSANLLNVVTIGGYYENSTSEDGTVNSMSAQAKIIDGIVPKITNLSASYTQRNVKKLFEFRTPTTNIEITGGYKISPDVSLIFLYSEYYEDKDNNGEINGSSEVITNWSIQTKFDF